MARRPGDRGESAASSPPFSPPGWVRVGDGRLTWWVDQRWRDALVGPGGFRLDEWRGRGALATVKTGPFRAVYRVDLPEATVFVKHFRVPDFRTKLRQWLRRGKGRNEGKRAALLDRIGIPTIRPIALGERRRYRFLLENYLVTLGIPDSVPLDRFVEGALAGDGPLRPATRRQLAVELGRMTATLHDHGIVHRDFHPGNILVRAGSGSVPGLAMIDLDALRQLRHLGWGAARDNLALLNHYFWTRSGRTDRRRFLRAYLAARDVAPADPGRFARGIEAATRAWAERLWARWGRRCRGTNKYFKRFRTPEARGIASRRLDRATMKRLVADPDAPFRDPATRLLKDSRTTTVAELDLLVDGRPTRVIYKRFNRKKGLDPLLTLWRGSRGWHSWQAGGHLASRGVPTPANLAYIARLWPAAAPGVLRCLPAATYVATIKAEPAITLGDYLRDALPALDPAERRRRLRGLTAALARLVRLMHDRSLSHRDLKSSNILIEGDPAASPPRLSVIDLVGVHLARPLPRGRRVQNLARLALSCGQSGAIRAGDALRFLKSYIPPAAEGRPWKDLWRAVARKSRSKLTQNRRRGRPLS